MTTVVRATRVLLILCLAMMTISLIIGIGSSSVGWVERIVLMLLIGGCVYAAAKVTDASRWLVHRLGD